jgi:hypothetical protein
VNVTNTPKNSRRQKENWRGRKQDGVRKGSIKESGRHPVDEMACGKDCIIPKMFGYMHMKQESSGNIKQVSVLALSNTILL